MTTPSPDQPDYLPPAAEPASGSAQWGGRPTEPAAPPTQNPPPYSAAGAPTPPPAEPYPDPYTSPAQAGYEAAQPYPAQPNEASPTGQYPPAPAYGYGYALPPHPQAGTILALGIIGLFIPVTSPFAWYMGGQARKDIAAGRYSDSGSITAGWVLGIIGTVGLIIWIAAIVFMVIGIIGMAAMSG